MNIDLLVDGLGCIGSLELLLAFWLVSNKRLLPVSVVYQSLNFTGSVFLLINTAYYGAFPSSFLNLVWGLIALVTLSRLILNSQKSL